MPAIIFSQTFLMFHPEIVTEAFSFLSETFPGRVFIGL